MKKEEELKRFSQSRQALLKAIDSLTADELSSIQVEGIWTSKDLLGHIAAWEKTLLEPLTAFVNGKPFEAQIITDLDAWNAEQAARRSSLSNSEIFKEMGTTRQALLKITDKLSESQWSQTFQAPWGDHNTIIEMISGLAWHEEEHLKSILLKFPK